MQNKISSYKDLIVWQKSNDLVLEIYNVSRKLPKQEIYGLCSQIQRAAISIPSNIAEGHARNHTKEFVQFLAIAFGSSAELETQILLMEKLYPDFNYELIKSLLIEVQKMLMALIKKLQSTMTK
jgi:four helix bundle protein